MKILLVGAGATGGRAARQLAETPGVELFVSDRRASRARAVAHALSATVVDDERDWPDELDAVAVALPRPHDVAIVRAAIDRGIAVTSTTDDHESIRAMLDLDSEARRAGVAVVPGAGLAPGLADVLARHAAGALDSVDEVHVARHGAAGGASRSEVREARRDRAVEWVDGAWAVASGNGPELVWFPDPIGAQECEGAAGGVALLAAAFPDARRLTYRLGEPATRRSMPWRRGLDEQWGSVRVEVWGRRGVALEPVVYGAIDRTAFAAGTVLAVVAVSLASGDGLVDAAPGVAGLARRADPPALLAELARRGLKAAAFEGVPIG